MTLKSVLTQAEYIGYLKGSIINLLVEADLNCLDRATEMMGELRALVAEADDPIPFEAVPGAESPDKLTSARMIEIRDSMNRLAKK